MDRQVLRWGLLAFVLLIGLVLLSSGLDSQAEETASSPLVTGTVLDPQDLPVESAQVSLRAEDGAEPLSTASTQSNGRYALTVPESIPDEISIHIKRAHFEEASIALDATAIRDLRNGQSVVLPDAVLPRQITAAFWIATLIFIGMLVLIATGRLHTTLAARVGASLVFAVS